MKKIFSRKYLIAILPLTLIFSVSVAATDTDFNVAKNLEILFNVFKEVNNYYVDEVNPDELMRNGADGMLSGLDPYTEFLSESDMENFEILTTGKYGGIGALVRQRGEWIEISQPYRGFAADKAGLRIGDKILEINGKDMRNASIEKVTGLMRGDAGTRFNMKIQRVEDGKIVNLTLKRERIIISGVPYYGMIGDSTGYILHNDFSEDCSNDIKAAVTDMKRRGMKSLIIDLRNNGGGILQEAVKITGMFVPKQTAVVSIKGRSREIDATYKTTSEPLDTAIRVAMLIGRGSASASEIVSGAFQDVDRAVIIGQRSFGKGLVQTTRPVGFNSYVKITTARYYIPSGRCIQALDYTHRNEDGSVGYVPDSLVREFRTLNGRKVFDGGGITPDIKIEAPSISAFTYQLYLKGYIEDFAAEYLKSTNFALVDPNTFSLSAADYENFIRFMSTRSVNFESETKASLNELARNAAKEKYADRIAAEIEQIRNKITKDKDSELREFRDEITALIEDNIVLYHNYEQGVVRLKLRSDKTVAEAVRILSDKEAYNLILRTQDTSRE